jgi:hypothetical protein
MSLHDTAEFGKKAALVLGIGFGVIIFISISIKVGGFINTLLHPPKIAPPNEAYGKLPSLPFPKSTVNGQFTYTINTLNGELPQDFPDRLVVYPMIINQPNLLNLDDTKNKVAAIGFVDDTGNPLHEIPLGGPNYEWAELTGFQRKIVYDIVSQNFTMTSNYLTSLTVLNAQNLGDQTDAVGTVQDFLGSLSSFPSDIDLTLTQNPDPTTDYTTMPQIFSITNGVLTPTTSLSNAQIIRVDLYQKEIDYSFTAGTDQDLTHFQDFDMKMPILYPHPPYSTMNFLIGAGPSQSEVVSAIYNHQTINLQPDTQATYPTKTAQVAFDDLKNGKGYIAAYNGTGNQIQITKVYLAYYLGATQQNYLIPVVVFEGQDGFFAYVPAVDDSAMQ